MNAIKLFIRLVVIILFFYVAIPSGIQSVQAQDVTSEPATLPGGEKITTNKTDLDQVGGVEETGSGPIEIQKNMEIKLPIKLTAAQQVQTTSISVDGWNTIMSQNFEWGFPAAGWNVFDLGNYGGEYYWGKTNYKSHLGSYSAWAARGGASGLDPVYGYPNNMESWMVYGPFDLSGVSDAAVDFSYWNLSELNYDYFGWYASIDGSSFYGTGVSGDSGGWKDVSFPLTSVYTLGNLVGQPNVWIAFIFESDSSYGDEGTFVDDIVVKKYYPVPGGFYKFNPANNAVSQPSNPTLKWYASPAATSYEYCIDTVNNNACDTAWKSSGAATSAALSGLQASTAYYWQVRAINLDGTTYGNGGTWWKFTTGPVPSAFSKSSPANAGINQLSNPILRWYASSSATGYEYCVDTTNNTACDTTWKSTGTVTSASLSGLKASTAYYWQVRALNQNGSTLANGGPWWKFTTGPAPSPFWKSSPVNASANQLPALTLRWYPISDATSYEYCIDTANNNVCDTTWNSTGAVTSAPLSGLLASKSYYWQVRAINQYGSTLANGGAWWLFATGPAPSPFSKASPANSAVNQPSNNTIRWYPIPDATSYEYCIDTVNNNACDTTWISAGANSSAPLSKLLASTTYYWQVRALNQYGSTLANGGPWWSFTTGPKPLSFIKLGPANASIDIPIDMTLSWEASPGADSYDYCIDKINDAVCNTGWVTAGTSTSVGLTGLDPAATYYWQIRAKNIFGKLKADGGSWWSFTTIP